MATIEKIDKIKKVKGATKAVKPIAVEEELQRVGPNKDKFDKLMVGKTDQTQKIQPDLKLDSSRKKSPIEEMRDISSASSKPTRVTPPELIAQTQEAINKMEEIKGTLQTPDVQVKESLTPLLDNKLTHINENINAALSRTGAEYAAAPVTPIAPSQNPVMRFLGFLTDGQYKLQTMALEVERMHLRKEDINPAALLMVQIKVGMITQELEFFSSLLNKALESTKTIMNIQV